MDFKVLTTSDASNNEGKLVARVEYVRDKLIGGKVNWIAIHDVLDDRKVEINSIIRLW